MVELRPDADRFWHFALDLYRPQGNRALFLRVQDDAGLDVPLALFCLWCGSEGLHLSEPAMGEAVAFSAAWRAARIEPLRALRRAWKASPGPFPAALAEDARQQVAGAEQAVERLQMDHLVTLRRGAQGDGQAVATNLALYVRLARLSLEESDFNGLTSLMVP